MRILIGGVGYPNLSDLSLGPLLVDELRKLSWPEGVEVEDLSYGPIAILHSFSEREPYDRVVLVASVGREQKPGTIRRYRWNHELPSAEEIQARVVEAATGVISLENLLVVATQFKKLPGDVVILEVEPWRDTFGETLSDPMIALIPQLAEELQQVWSRPATIQGLEDYQFVIPDAADRPTGWTVRAASPFWNESN